MQIQKTRLVVIIIISLLVAITIYLSVACFLLSAELKDVKVNLKAQEVNEKSVFFAKLFIDKILLSSGTVNFEDRLKLENAVRDLADPEVLSQWQQLTESKGDAETQKIVGNILKLLIGK